MFNAMTFRTQCLFPLAALACAMVVALSPACRRDSDEAEDAKASDAVASRRADILVFPDELKVDDASVNEFLSRAMTVCTQNDYDAFRLLWSARREPLARAEFEKGWQAVTRIRILALEKVILAQEPGADPPLGETAYAALADVRLDPTRLARDVESERQVVLMLVKEHDRWCLGHAPKDVRKWLKEKVTGVAPNESQDSVPQTLQATQEPSPP